MCIAFGVHSFRSYFSLSLSSQALVLLFVSFVRRSIHIFVFFVFFFFAFFHFWCIAASDVAVCASCARMCWETWLLLCWLQTGCGFLINRQWKMKKKKSDLLLMNLVLFSWYFHRCSMDAPQPHKPIRSDCRMEQMFSGHSWHISFDISFLPLLPIRLADMPVRPMVHSSLFLSRRLGGTVACPPFHNLLLNDF